MKPEIEEKPMRRYLLGDLPDREATALEQEFFADDEKFERMWAIENSLVDGYVRGSLPAEDRERFERHYLASPVHRQRVAVARNLIEQADGVGAGVAVTTALKISWRARLSEQLGLSPAPWQFALTAATLLLAAISLWLFLDRTRLRDEVAQLKTEREARQNREQELAHQVATARGEGEKMASEVERLRAGQNATPPQPTPPQLTTPQPAPAPVASRPRVFSFLLSPTLVRSGGDQQTLTVPPRTGVVRLQMKAEEEGARRFQVSVRTVEGRQIWSQQTIKPRHDGDNAIITVHIPAGKLGRGDYILTLSAVNPTGEPEEVGRYFFRVIRR